MKVLRTISGIRKVVKAARLAGKKVGFVPTMGALHAGHISLINAARRKCDFVTVSIFVNPTQFGPTEDFQRYPRSVGADLQACKKAGADAVFLPPVREMYPSENLTWVTVEKISEPLCGGIRPGHFRGVATVCSKLFNIVQPDIAFFGQKDAQQVAVIKRMAADLNMPLKIVVCPTVREPDGLAMSSRNKYLSAKERGEATVLSRSLQKCREMVEGGAKDARTIIREMRKVIMQAPGAEVEYISIVNSESLEEVREVSGKVLAAIAVKIGRTRLIDNLLVDTRKR